DLRYGLVAPGFERLGDRLLERTPKREFGLSRCTCQPAEFHIAQVLPQLPDPAARLHLTSEVLRANRGHYLDSAARASDRNVQAPLPSIVGKRSHLQREGAVCVTGVANTENHDVALIALNALKVLYEEAMQTVVTEKVIEVRPMCPRVLDGGQYRLLLRIR